MRAGVGGQLRLHAGRPHARGLGQQKTLGARAVSVSAGRGAVTGRGARHRAERHVRVRAERVGGQLRLDAGRPHARGLGQQQTLEVARAAYVAADRAAVTRRGAGHGAKDEARLRAGVGGQLRLHAGRPRPRGLGQQQTLKVTRAVGVLADRAALTRRSARHRADRDARVRARVSRQQSLHPGTPIRVRRRQRPRRPQHKHAQHPKNNQHPHQPHTQARQHHCSSPDPHAPGNPRQTKFQVSTPGQRPAVTSPSPKQRLRPRAPSFPFALVAGLAIAGLPTDWLMNQYSCTASSRRADRGRSRVLGAAQPAAAPRRRAVFASRAFLALVFQTRRSQVSAHVSAILKAGFASPVVSQVGPGLSCADTPRPPARCHRPGGRLGG